MTIGQLASHAGVGVETVRFYERRGLVSQRARPREGYRQYTMDDAQRIRFIRRAQGLGFSLAEIAELLRLADTPAASRHEVRALVEARAADVEERIRGLQRVKESLDRLAHACHAADADADCPIIESLLEEEH